MRGCENGGSKPRPAICLIVAPAKKVFKQPIYIDIFTKPLKNISMKHEIDPVYDRNSKILILGSFPSEASRSAGFYYGHKQNRFWKTLSAAVGKSCGDGKEEKTKFLLDNNIALWDVISSCTVTGSSDSSIKDVIPNDITSILDTADIKAVYLNGKLANKLFEKYIKCDIPHYCLPSTSPANAAYSLDRLISEWSFICCNL